MRQSPIDLPAVEPVVVMEYGPILFDGSYTNESTITEFDEGELTNNGHTAKYSVSMPNDLIIREGPYGEEEYQFLQLHFHWGSVDEQGSEHTIDGTEFPLEMHMVHINSKYVDGEGNLDTAYATESDGLAVLGFLFHIDDTANDTIESLTDGILSLVSPNMTRRYIAANVIDALTRRYTGGDAIDATFDIAEFVAMVNVDDYYTYNGSLTTPDCNEVVTWVVFKHSIGIPSSVLSAFRSLEDSHGDPLVDNFRPPQPLNGRHIGNAEPDTSVDTGPCSSFQPTEIDVNNTAGLLYSPGYPEYPNLASCSWIISVEDDQFIQLTFIDFELENK